MRDPDLLDQVEQQLADARMLAAKAYDRVEALLHVRGVAQEAATLRGLLPVRPGDLWAVCEGVEQQAALQAALDRCLQP